VGGAPAFAPPAVPAEPMLGQLPLLDGFSDEPEGGAAVLAPVAPLELGLAADVEALVVWAGVDDAVVLAVAAESPMPRLNPSALAAIPAATKGRLYLMVVLLLTGVAMTHWNELTPSTLGPPGSALPLPVEPGC
jgi:hypothetical protein